MALHIFCVLIVIACCSAEYSNAQGRVVRSSSSSSGPGKAPQMCSLDNNNNIDVNFYCREQSQCLPREQRCTGAATTCSTANQDCYPTSTSGQYSVRLGHANLGLFGSKKTILEHRFIVYRGFTYEFGKSYQVQILDIADPDYKYINGRELNRGGIETGLILCH